MFVYLVALNLTDLKCSVPVNPFSVSTVQVFACRKVFEALQSPACHEVAIKVAGFLLGEFGHLLNEDPRSTVRL